MAGNAIEIYQILGDDTIVSLGSSAHAEVEAATNVELYPAAGFHIFFAERILGPCDPPEKEAGRDTYWGTTRGYEDMPS